MRMLRAFALLVSIAGCASHVHPTTLTTPVRIGSGNNSDVDVYVLCGDRDPLPLGTVRARADTVFAIPTSRLYCQAGINFFLVVRSYNHGYWVGPIRPAQRAEIALWIEKYAGLSTVRALAP